MKRKAMKQTILAALAVAVTALSAEFFAPREIMARSAEKLNLEDVIPKNFKGWQFNPHVRLIEPPYPDSLSRQIYSQEIGRGYSNSDGQTIMLLVAYGPNQSQRLQLHRPEICYAAEGFSVSKPITVRIAFTDGKADLRANRLVARRESRVEHIMYWMRLGNDTATGVVERQLIRMKYIFSGQIPDGTLIRVSTVGLPPEKAYSLEEKFIRDLLAEIRPNNLHFFVGDSRGTH